MSHMPVKQKIGGEAGLPVRTPAPHCLLERVTIIGPCLPVFIHPRVTVCACVLFREIEMCFLLRQILEILIFNLFLIYFFSVEITIVRLYGIQCHVLVHIQIE